MKGFTISDETNPKRKLQKLIERKEHLKTQIEIMQDQIEIMNSIIEELNIEITKKDSINTIWEHIMSDNDCKNYLPCKDQIRCRRENYIKWRDCQMQRDTSKNGIGYDKL